MLYAEIKASFDVDKYNQRFLGPIKIGWMTLLDGNHTNIIKTYKQ